MDTKPVRVCGSVGETYGRLTILAEAEPAAKYQRRVHCRCECGTERIFHLGNLRSGASKSCGCLARENASKAARTHGKTGSSEYNIWAGMRRRCFNERDAAFGHYGARGITVCARWRASFEAFYQDMGPRPSAQHSMDRVDNMRGYNCGHCDDCVARGDGANCRWATQKVQARNTRRNVWLEFGGKRMLATDWAKSLGISRQAVQQRIAAGWTEDDVARRPRVSRQAIFMGRPVMEWSTETGIAYSTLRQRIKRGWSKDDVLSPPGSRRKTKPKSAPQQKPHRPHRPHRCRQCDMVGHNSATCENVTGKAA